MPEGFPIIEEAPTTRVVEKGREATLTCRAVGKQPLNIIWLKDLLPFQPNERFSFLGENGGTFFPLSL